MGDSVVAFSDQRPEKISEPFAILGDGYTAIAIGSSTYTPFRYVRATVEAVRKVWRDRPEVILTDHFGPLSTIVAMLGLVFRVPVVVRIGGYPLRVKCRKVRDRLRNHQLSALPLLALMLNIKFIMMAYLRISRDSHCNEFEIRREVRGVR